MRFWPKRFVKILTAALLTAYSGSAAVPTFAETDQLPNADAHHDSEFGKDEGNALKEREQWFNSHHQLPNGKSATALFKQAQVAAQKVPAAARKSTGGPRTAPTGSAPGTWTALGPAPIGTGTGFTEDPMPVSGRVSSIAISTTSAGETLYVGAADGGVWKSTDNGSTWTPLTDNQASLAIGSIAVDPVNPKYVYAGTGEMHFSGDSYFGRGVLKSVDGGKTWTLYGASTFDGQHISSIIVDPTNHSNIYVAADGGIYKSTNYGVSYQRLKLPEEQSYLPDFAVDLKMDPLNSKVLYASILGQGIFKTTDGGLTWTLLNTETSGLPTSGFDVATVAIGTKDQSGQDADQIVYAAFSDSYTGDLKGLYKSTDGGETWTQLSSVPDYFDEGYAYEGQESGSGQGWYDNTLAVDPSNPDHVLAGGITIIETTDGGSTWTNLADPTSGSPIVNIHPDQHAIAFDTAGNAFIGNDGGVWEYKADGTWVNLNTNLSITQFYPGISTTGTGSNRIVIGGTQDNGTDRYNGSTVWDQIFGGDGGYTAIDPTNPDTVYVEAEGGDIYQLTNGGQNSTPVSPDYQQDEYVPFIVPFMLEPSDPTKMLVGGGYLHEGQYDGNSGTWQWTTLTSHNFSEDYGISAIAQSATNPDTIYVGTADGMVYATFDHGQTWAPITPAYADYGLPVSGIVIDPNNDKSIYVAYGGYSYPGRNAHVFCTADASASIPSWVNLTGNLPNAPINAIALKQGNLYVGTDVGVFVAAQGSKFWSSLNAGLPNTPVTSLAFTQDNQLIAGTHGRGVFITDVSSIATQSLLSITPGNQQLQVGQSVNLKAQITVNGKVQDVTSSVTWRSQNPTIASVNSVGQLIGRSVGTATVTATYKGQVATITVKVTPAMTNLVIAPPTPALQIGTPAWVSVLAQYADGSTEDVTDQANLTSSAPSVATVDDQGLITPKKTGTTNITASFGGKKATQTVTVTPAVDKLTAQLTVNNQPTSVVPLTQTATLTVTAKYVDGTTGDVTKFANIQSVNGNVTVNGNKVTGIDKGDDTLVIEFGGQSTSVDLTVTAAVKNIFITPKPPLFYEMGATKQLTAVATYVDGSTSDITSDDKAVWTTSNPGVATVQDGLVTAVGQGTATITFTYPGQSPIKIPVTVTPDAAITSLSPTKAAPGQTVTITGKNFDLPGTVTIGGKPAQVKTWSTSSIQVVVPTIDIGPASITVQPDGGGASATYDNFTVLPAAPVISGVQPTSAHAGQTVTIQGTFPTIQPPTVTFAGTAATVENATSTAITVVVPQIAAGKPAIVVTTDGGKSAPYTGFTVLPGPTITSMSPTSASWGQTVTITGNNFGTNLGNVSVGGQPATITKWTNTSISITVPTVGAGKQPVIVTTADGISSAPYSGFTVTAPPVTQLVFQGVQNNETNGTQGSPVFVKVQALDANGKPVAGQTISFSTDGGDLSNTSAVTNAQGIAAVAVNNKDLNLVHLTASWGTSGSVKQSLTINYTPGQQKSMDVTGFNNSYIHSGDTFTVYGSGFGSSQGQGTFTFTYGNETKTATVSNWSDTEIDVVVPQFQSQIGDGDSLTFTITNDAGDSFTCPSGYVYWAGSSGSPGGGLQVYAVFGDSADGQTIVPGTKIYIAGAGFGDTQGTSVVKLGSTTLKPTMIDYGNGPVPDWSDTWITCDVPSNVQTGTSVTFSITVGNNTVTKSVKVQAVPAVTSVGQGALGSTWTISGVNLGTQGTLNIDGTPIKGTWSNTRITFTAPSALPDGLNALEIQPAVGGAFHWDVPWQGQESPDWTMFTQPYVYGGGNGTTGYILTGQSFGDTPGIVLVNGVLASFTKWSNGEIDLATTVPNGAWIEVVNEYGLAVFFHISPAANSNIRKMLQLHQLALHRIP